MQHGRKTNINRHQKRPFAGRSQQRPSSALRPDLRDSHNARRNYDRYLALAQAELLAGDRGRLRAVSPLALPWLRLAKALFRQAPAPHQPLVGPTVDSPVRSAADRTDQCKRYWLQAVAKPQHAEGTVAQDATQTAP
jgi:hypothetical protein